MSKYAKQVNKCLERFKQGDYSLLPELMDLTSNHLSAVAKVYLRNRSDYEDIVMETYERAIAYIDSFDTDSDGYNWLCKIAQNTAFLYNKRDMPHDDIDKEVISVEVFDDVDDRVNLSLAINDLDEDDRKLIIMYFYESKSCEQIAQALEVNRAGVHKKLKRICRDMAKSARLN